MRFIDQTCVDPGLGNCHQAVIASLFDLDLDMVPNFIKFKRLRFSWAQVYSNFLFSIGYEWNGSAYFTKRVLKFEASNFLKYEDSVEGLFDASVHSKTFDGGSHAVIIDINGIVVHDPNPNKLWLGLPTLVENGLQYISLIRKIEKSGREN